MPHIDSPLPLQIYFTLNANTAYRGYRSFLCPRTRASTAVDFSLYRYRNVRFCALPLPLTFVLNANTACRGYCSFLCPRTRASTAVVSRYTAIVMCALAHFIAAHFCTQREHRLSRLSFFFISTPPCKHGGGHKKEHSHK